MSSFAVSMNRCVWFLLLLCAADARTAGAQAVGEGPATSVMDASLAGMPIAASVGSRVEEARRHILAMNLEAVDRALDMRSLSVDEAALVGWTRELARLLELLVADSSSDYDAFLERNERLYEQVDEAPGTAWRHWLLGEISLQRTWARSKRGDAFKAAWSARRALGHLERARALDPGLIEPLKGLGLLHMGIGALPDRFRRVLGWFGIEGSLDQGLAELASARDASVWNRQEAAVLLATVDKFGFPSPVDAAEVYAELWAASPGSPLIGLSYADVLIRERQPVEALAVLDATSDPSGTVHYLIWYRGEALYRLGHCPQAEAAFAEYERIHEGASLKLAGRLLAGQCAELGGRRQEAESWYARIVGERGFAEELAAQRRAARLLESPMTEGEKDLLRAWGSFDSGRDSTAMAQFSALVESRHETSHVRAEATYGVARVFHETGETSEAITWYERTLAEAADPLAKWHGFARMHLVELYLDSGHEQRALSTLSDLHAMEEAYDYRSSVENRVRFLITD
jgi:tetratricopeptide (TPR) repeat protein